MIPLKLKKIILDYSAKIKRFLIDDFGQCTPEQRKEFAREATDLAAVTGSLVTPIPLPFADIFTVLPIQIGMVQAIGNIYGYKLTEKNAKAAIATIGGGILGQQVCLALFKIGMPGAGGLGGAAFVYVWTHAMGVAAQRYYSSGMKLSKDQLSAIRKQATQDAIQRKQDRGAP